MPTPNNNKFLDRLEKARQYGFRQCLDFIMESMADCETLDELAAEIDRLEGRIREGICEQVRKNHILI